MFRRILPRRKIIGGFLIALLGSVVLLSLPSAVQAATTTVRPNGDTTTQWNLGGTSDGSCTGSHCSKVDEASPNTTDYIETTILLGGNIIDEFDMGNTDVGQGATQITVRVYARSALALPILDAMDQIQVSLWINGAYISGSPTITPVFPAWNWFDVTFTGSWTQSQVDGMRVKIANSIQGLGLVQNNLQVSTVEATITYTPKPVLTQTPYRFYSNADSLTPGSPLAATNTAAELPQKQAPFRLRMGTTISTQALPANYQSYKLQYATMSGTCDTSFSGEIYSDMSSSTGAIRWSDNTSIASGTAISSIANDPTTTGSKTYQTYQEANSFSNPNATTVGNTALWDFSLQDSAATPGTTYCFRLVYNDGSLLDTYTDIPAVTAVGDLGVGVVDASGSAVSQPTVSFGAVPADSSQCQNTTATLGVSSQKLRITNDLVSNGWNITIAPTNGPSSLWTATGGAYDFNETSGNPSGCADGSDSDSKAGQLSINPTAATITPKSGCSATGITKGSNASFSQGSVDAVQLLSASSNSQRFCWWDTTGITMQQKVPVGTPVGSYAMDLTITAIAQ